MQIQSMQLGASIYFWPFSADQNSLFQNMSMDYIIDQLQLHHTIVITQGPSPTEAP